MLYWLLQNTIVAALLAAGVLVVCRWRRIGPAGRHLLWVVVLLKLVTPPLVSWPWAMPRWDERVGGRAGWRQPPEASGRLRSRLASDGNPDGESESPKNGTVVRSETFVVTLPAKKRSEADPAETTARVPVQGSDRDAHSVRVAEPLPPRPPWWAQLSSTFWLTAVWCGGSALYFLLQLVRIRRMSSRLRTTDAPPGWLTDEIERWAEQLRVAPPTTCVVSGFSSPFLWAFRRVRLIWPQRLTEETNLDAWRGVVVHELAHLKRRDHWVGWLELVAGCVWWWNPMFWYVRSQLRENAELACDAWVVETLPGGRRQYAEALLTVCEHFSRPQVSAAALGVGGARRNLERRLTMILKDRVPFRVSRGLLCAAGVLALLILPGWAQPPRNAEPLRDNPQGTTDSPGETQIPIPAGVKKQPTPAANNAAARNEEGGAGGRPVIGPEPVRPRTTQSQAARVRQLEKKLQALQRELLALRSRSAPGMTRGPRLGFGAIEAKRAATRDTEPIRRRKEVLGSSTITLQQTLYRLPTSRAKALKSFLEQHIKADVLQIKIRSGGVQESGASIGAPNPPMISITTTADVQEAIGAIIALMRQDEVPRDQPKADTFSGTNTPRRTRNFGRPGGFNPSPGGIPDPSSGGPVAPGASLNPTVPSRPRPAKSSRQ